MGKQQPELLIIEIKAYYFSQQVFEAGISIHEISHGLSTRLTGGPENSGCLGWGESAGMGERWGDFLATTTFAVPGSTLITLWVRELQTGTSESETMFTLWYVIHS